jgi:hypothetical protein
VTSVRVAAPPVDVFKFNEGPMRGRFITVFCALALGASVNSASAQTIGFKIGPTFSNLSVSHNSGAENHTLSLGGGGFIRFGMAGLSLQAEVLALTEGAKVEDTSRGDGNAKLKLGYIKVPVTAMFSLGNGPYVFVAFENSCKLEITSGSNSLSGNCDDTGEDIFARKKTDLDWSAALGSTYRRVRAASVGRPLYLWAREPER